MKGTFSCLHAMIRSEILAEDSTNVIKMIVNEALDAFKRDVIDKPKELLVNGDRTIS